MPRIAVGWAVLRRAAGSRRAQVAALGVVLGAAVSASSFPLQEHFQAVYQAGGRLAGWQEFLRLGAPWEALPPVLAAAALAFIGWWRLGSAAPEPSWAPPSDRPPSASRLRSGLRRERRTVLLLADAVRVLAIIALVRLGVYAGLAAAGDQLAASTLSGVVLEAAAWTLFAIGVEGWRRRYLRLLESWGV